MRVFSEPPKPEDTDYIFTTDINDLVEECFPNHEGQHPIFKKFGVRYAGICDSWYYTKDWKDLPELEKWKYVALCSLYWQKQYENWYEKSQYELYKHQLLEWAEIKPEFLETYNRLIEMEKEVN